MAARVRKPSPVEEPVEAVVVEEAPVEESVEVVVEAVVEAPKAVLGIDGKNPITPNNPPAKAQ